MKNGFNVGNFAVSSIKETYTSTSFCRYQVFFFFFFLVSSFLSFSGAWLKFVHFEFCFFVCPGLSVLLLKHLSWLFFCLVYPKEKRWKKALLVCLYCCCYVQQNTVQNIQLCFA